MAGIMYSDYYLPEDTAPTKEFVDEKIASVFVKQYKLEYIYLEKKKNPVEIFQGLLNGFFDKSGIKPEEISHIIYTSSQNLMIDRNCIPFLLQGLYKMNQATVVLFRQGCNTVLQAMEFANALVETGKASNVIILSLSYGTPREQRFLRTSVIGDGAGIMVVGKQGYRTKILDFISISDGRTCLNVYEKKEYKVDSLDIIRDGSDLILKLLKNNNVDIKDIRMVIPQNLNFLGFFAYARILGIDLSKIYSKNISKGGHMIDVDTVRNYTDYEKETASTRENGKFLLFGTGTLGELNTTHDALLLQ